MDQQRKLARPAQLTTTKATDAVPDSEASTEHYAAFAGKPQYVISNLFLPLLLKLQTKIEQQAKHSKKIVKVSSDSLPLRLHVAPT